MIRYHINVNTGDDDHTTTFYFVSKDRQKLSEEETNSSFNEAVHELNRIYKTFGRFATHTGVTRLFEHYGFERTVAD